MRELSKYQAKKRKQFLEKHPDSGEIAIKLVEARKDLDTYYKLRYAELGDPDGRLFIKTEILHTEFGDEKTNIYAEMSKDRLAWYIVKPVPWKGNRYWFKVVPEFEDNRETIATILDSQPWYYL